MKNIEKINYQIREITRSLEVITDALMAETSNAGILLLRFLSKEIEVLADLIKDEQKESEDVNSN